MDDTKKQAIFDQIFELFKPYSPPYKLYDELNVSGKRSVGLLAEGDYVIEGRKRKEVYFAGIIMQKHYVGFYFMPIYTAPEEMRMLFSERLLKCLKGKSCFYIKSGDKAMMDDIKRALAEGFRVYKARGWV